MELGSWRAGKPAKVLCLARGLTFLIGFAFFTAAFAQEPKNPTECDQIARKILSDIRISFLAKEGEIYIQSARRSFAESPPGCAGGLWYLAAARLLREPGQKAPLEGGGINLKDAKEALERGLALDPREPQLLAFVAYLSAVSPSDSPPLPENACSLVSGNEAAPQDLTAYVCGHSALRRKDYSSAEKFFKLVEGSYSFPDAALRRAEALLALGRRKEARKSAELALDILHPRSLLLFASGASDSEVRDLRKRASEIAGSK